jgi:hypothetical protein
MKIKDDLIMENEAVSNTSANSQEIDMRSMLVASIELVYTGSSLAGSAKLQYRMTPTGTWRDLPNSGETATHTLGASGGNHMWSLTNVAFPFLRLVVTTTDADTATCTARTFAKGV